MKNIIKSVFFAFAVFASVQSFAQKGKSFEGVITYKVDVDAVELDPMSKSMIENMQILVYIKGDKSRMEQDMGMMKTTVISDGKAKTAVSLLDIMGQKLMVKTSAEEVAKEETKAGETSYKYTNETKEIAGYKCKKAEATSPESEEPLTIYYTEEIPVNQGSSQFKGLKGFPLQYEVNQGGMKMVVTAHSVKTEKVPDSKFAIPADYKEVSKEELQQMFGGM
jgi:GLPGLI family protein